jgi:hypothetical protein
MTSNEAYIQKMLSDLAAETNVKILFAIESGSRAWGFPSEDSDFDVRFIYVRKQNDYLSVCDFRDVIETPLVHDEFLKVPIDLNGWDLRKALLLGLKSNAVLIEWLKSPVRYMADNKILQQFDDFVLNNANIPSLLYHYDRLAKHAWQEIDAGPDSVKIKRYFYALRPALACVWMRCYHRTPPMNILELTAGLNLPEGFMEQLHQYIEAKSKALESDMVKRNPIFDDFISAALSESATRPDQREVSPHSITEANKLFRSWIS